MTVKSFNYASAHKWCRKTDNPQDLFGPDNVIYCPQPREKYTLKPAEHVLKYDKIGDLNQFYEDNILIKDQEFIIGDLFLTAINDVKLFRKNIYLDSYHIFLDESIALAESCGNEFYSDLAVTRESIKVPQNALNLDGYKLPEGEDKPIKIRFYNDQEAIKHFDEDVIILTSPHADNFFHWMLDVLPRFWFNDAFPEMKNMTIILPDNIQTPYWEEFLKIIGKERSYYICKDGPISCKRAYIPSLSSGCSPKQIKFVEKFLTESFGVSTSPTRKKKIYISRTDAEKRKIRNEDDVLEVLEEYGFEKVILTELSMKEQIELFREVDIVVAPHGAGNSNMIFADEGATLIEFIPKAYRQRIFWLTTDFKNQKYGRFIVETNDKLDTMKVDITRFRKFIDPILSK